MATIRERVIADPVISALWHAQPRPVDVITDALNAQCVAQKIPEQVTAAFILDLSPRAWVLFDLLRSAAAGESVQEQAAALLSDEGLTVMVDGFVPPFVYLWDVADALYHPDGSETTE